MKITFLGHAGFLVEHRGTALLMDPWFSRRGAFERAWFQFPRNHHLLNEIVPRLRQARTRAAISSTRGWRGRR